MRSKLMTCLMALLLASPVLAENPRIPNDINFELPASDTQWHIVTKQNNTPVLRFYTYQGTSAWSSLGWTPKFKYSKTDSSTSMAEIAGVSYTNYIDFQATTNTFPYAVEKWYCTVLLSTGILDISQASGLLSIERSPELTAGTLVYASPLINWASYTFTNTTRYGPYLAGSNMVLRDVGTNGQFYFDVLLTNAVDLATYSILTNAVTNTIIKLNAVSNDVVSARLVADLSSNHTYNVVWPKLTAVSNDTVSARTVADAGSNLAYTAWGWGNHALVGYLRAGSNVSALANDAGYLTSVTNHNQAWSTITSTPISLFGYGITNLIGDMFKADNLSGLANYATARSNLGLGSASTNANTDFYYASNPSAYVDATITNAHAQLVGIQAHGNGSASTNMTADFATAAQGAKADTALQNFAPFTVTTNYTVTTNITSVMTNVDITGFTGVSSDLNGQYAFDSATAYVKNELQHIYWLTNQWWIVWEDSSPTNYPGSTSENDPTAAHYAQDDQDATPSWNNTTNYSYTTNYTYVISSAGQIEFSGLTNVPASGLSGTVSVAHMPSEVATNNQPTVTAGTGVYQCVSVRTNLTAGSYINLSTDGTISNNNQGATYNMLLSSNQVPKHLFQPNGNYTARGDIYAGSAVNANYFRGLAGDTYFQGSAAGARLRLMFSNVAAGGIISFTNNNGTLTMQAGLAELQTNAIAIHAGTNLATWGSINGVTALKNVNSCVFTNLQTSPAGLPVGAVWLSGSNLIVVLP